MTTKATAPFIRLEQRKVEKLLCKLAEMKAAAKPHAAVESRNRAEYARLFARFLDAA